MQFKTLFTAIAAFAASTVIAGTAMAQAVGDYRSQTSGDWDTAATWDRWDGDSWEDAVNPPSTTTFATVQSAHSVGVTTGTAVSARVAVEGFVDIGNGKLTLHGSNGSTSTIASTKAITLEGSASILAFASNNHTLSGAGKVIMQHSAASIDIVAPTNGNRTLTNQATIEGMGILQGDLSAGGANPTATFVLERADSNGTPTTGVVHANAAGVLSFAASLLLDDTNYTVGGTFRPLWKSSGNSSAVLRFNESAGWMGPFLGGTPLEGQFEASSTGTLNFRAIVGTKGPLVNSNGNVVMECEQSFFYNYLVGPPETYDEISGDDC